MEKCAYPTVKKDSHTNVILSPAKTTKMTTKSSRKIK